MRQGPIAILPLSGAPRSSGNFVRNPNMRVLDLLISLCTWTGKTYCWPSHAKLCALLWQRYRIKMSTRTVIRHLNSLRRDLWITRKVRHQQDRQLGWTFRSSLYVPKPRCLQRLDRTATCLAKLLRSAIQSTPSSRMTKMADKLINLYLLALPAAQKRALQSG
jgi:hypothetical protein